LSLMSIRPPYFVPVVASVSLAYIVSIATLEVKPAHPMPISVSLGVSIASVTSAALAALLIAFLIRIGRLHVVKAILAFAMAYTSVVSSAMLASRAAPQLPFPVVAAVGILIALASLNTGIVGLTGQVALSAIFSNAIISTFGVKLPIALLAFLSIYDLWSVYRGPIRKLIREVERAYQGSPRREASRSKAPSFAPMVIEVKEGFIGFGDMISYALASSVAGRICPTLLSIAPLGALLAGVYLSFKIAAKLKHIPGLPIPISLWAATAAIVRLLA